MGSHSPFIPADKPAYAGWVPTITGQLSFSLIGLGGGSPDCVTANVEFLDSEVGHPRRRVALAQRRVTRDMPYTQFPVVQLCPAIAANFLLIGETRPAARPMVKQGAVSTRDDEIGVLVGEVVVIPHQSDHPDAEKRFLSRIRRQIAEVGDATPRAVIGPDARLNKEAENWLSEAGAASLQTARARFELYRTGEVRIELTHTMPIISDDPDEQAAFDDILASQIYYFIKDVSHRHYHHRKASDNLLPLTRIVADDDTSWRRETLWSLARAILEMRRSGKLPGHKSALGVLAYAEAFQGNLARTVRSKDVSIGFVATEDIACYDFTHTRQSLEATIAEKSFVHSHWTGIHSLLIATVLAFVALWLSAVQIRDVACFGVDCPVLPSGMRGALYIVLAQPHLAAGGVLAAALIYLEATRRSLTVATPLRVWGEFVGGWFDALGATISRWTRRSHPTWGDRIGAAIAWVYILFFVTVGLYGIGAIARLWSANLILLGGWLVSVLALAILPLLTRRRNARPWAEAIPPPQLIAPRRDRKP